MCIPIERYYSLAWIFMTFAQDAKIITKVMIMYLFSVTLSGKYLSLRQWSFWREEIKLSTLSEKSPRAISEEKRKINKAYLL